MILLIKYYQCLKLVIICKVNLGVWLIFFRVLNRSSSASYPFWVVSFGGPIVIIAAVIQAAFQRPYSIFAGAIVSKVTCHVL